MPSAGRARVMRRLNRLARSIAMLTVATMLAGCGHSFPAQQQGHDAQTEARREQDCANPQWKEANPGLWYNLCPSGLH